MPNPNDTATDLPELTEVSRLAIRPGDVVVVRLAGRVSREQAQRAHDLLKRAFPDNQVVVLDNSAELEVVTPS